MTPPQVGDQAPDFTLPDQNGQPVTLSKLRGKKVVVYFYPKVDTPVWPVPRGALPSGDQPSPQRRARNSRPAYPDSAPSTRSSCSFGLTWRKTSVMTPSASITNVDRSMPMYVRPYIDFSTQTP